MLNRFDIKPRKYAAVLTNGVSFLFVMATLINGVYSWTHSLLVTSAAAAARMIEGCFAIADEVLRLLLSASSTEAARSAHTSTSSSCAPGRGTPFKRYTVSVSLCLSSEEAYKIQRISYSLPQQEVPKKKRRPRDLGTSYKIDDLFRDSCFKVPPVYPRNVEEVRNLLNGRCQYKFPIWEHAEVLEDQGPHWKNFVEECLEPTNDALLFS
eukprot:scaffold575_cov170-Ochromonas_danica.AAC.2